MIRVVLQQRVSKGDGIEASVRSSVALWFGSFLDCDQGDYFDLDCLGGLAPGPGPLGNFDNLIGLFVVYPPRDSFLSPALRRFPAMSFLFLKLLQ